MKYYVSFSRQIDLNSVEMESGMEGIECFHNELTLLTLYFAYFYWTNS